MEKLIWETWEPVVAPYISKIEAYQLNWVFVMLLAAVLLATATDVVEYLDKWKADKKKCKVANIGIVALVVLGVVGFAVVVIWASTLGYAAYVGKYAKYENTYLTEVVPALERIQEAPDTGSILVDDIVTVMDYTMKLAYTVEKEENIKPTPVYWELADHWLSTDTGEGLADLCDYDKLVNAMDVQKVMKAIWKGEAEHD